MQSGTINKNPDMIDAHQHFWMLPRGDYGWLTPELKPLYRDYMPDDLGHILKMEGIAGTVLVQAAQTEDETRFLLGLANHYDFIQGVVGWMDMTREDAADQLDELQMNHWLKGIRPMIQDIPDPDWILQPALDNCFALIESRDLVFDALVRTEHLPQLLKRIEKYPDLKVVIDHAAKPPIAANHMEPWASYMKLLAQETSACCKFSGILTEAGQHSSFERLQPWIDLLFEYYGPERLIWGSDWPVLNMVTSYDQWLALAQRFCEAFNSQEQAAIFGDNARSVYQLQP
ncbi:amidohydrolase family protein [Spongorhabdus nitratireducens]